MHISVVLLNMRIYAYFILLMYTWNNCGFLYQPCKIGQFSHSPSALSITVVFCDEICFLVVGSYQLYDRLPVVQPEADGRSDVGVQAPAQCQQQTVIDAADGVPP